MSTTFPQRLNTSPLVGINGSSIANYLLHSISTRLLPVRTLLRGGGRQVWRWRGGRRVQGPASAAQSVTAVCRAPCSVTRVHVAVTDTPTTGTLTVSYSLWGVPW